MLSTGVILCIERFILIQLFQTIFWLIEEYRDNVVELRDSMLFSANSDNLNQTESSSYGTLPNSDTLMAVDELNHARKKLIKILEVSPNENFPCTSRMFLFKGFLCRGG